ncbi:hypothetical protein OQA88_9493 [Cercophora sp. LCS_1]
MDEKSAPLLPCDAVPPSPVRHHRKPRWPLFTLPLLALAWLYHTRTHGSCPSPSGPTTFTYPGESIPWTPCGSITAHPLECGTITVPLDHFNASNSPSNLNFTIPLIRLRAHNATTNKNILLNPGGPGGSGTEFLFRRGAQLSTLVGENFHLVGFDPRGINDSVPRAACYPSPSALQQLAPRPIYGLKDSGELWARAQNYGKACADTMAGYGPYINTPQTAADMNSILDALGQEGLYYWGFSYGTLLGQTYATLFPERSERVIIDGVANEFDWYEGLFDDESEASSDAVFNGFVEACIAAGDQCALAGSAGTKEELRDKIVGVIEGLKEEPVPVYVNNTVYGVLGHHEVMVALFGAMYKPYAAWAELAKNLAGLLDGNATGAFLACGWNPDRSEDVIFQAAEDFVMLNDGASGKKHWPQEREKLVELIKPRFNYSMFSEDIGDWFTKAAWPVPRGHGYVPKKGVHTAHPLLILSTTFDPICPLVSAVNANEAFVGSRIVEVKGAFLENGELPEKNVQCDGDGKPYFGSDEDAQASVMADDDQKLLDALVELAREGFGRRR